jgi:hypothetical protein
MNAFGTNAGRSEPFLVGSDHAGSSGVRGSRGFCAAVAHRAEPAVRDRQRPERLVTARRQRFPESLKQEYPKWKYHHSEPAVLVADPQAEADLGEGRADGPTPAEN